ncbi:DUF1824 family protein [Cyanobium sp. LEGE 06113]|uniref:DUF1824 family protein n=1 Tax=Cyanobium sp. LEGE 06113 TaxID=1297573 RepID=UPI00188017B7|nr:DUF1824 family protein [Cyanobium sp. LEGE 06113]MBE9153893.1 DUF1824 family protein [Cyanobium sp. LEGE 06113]
MAETLASLRGLRTAPRLDEQTTAALLEELLQKMALCEWFTVGVMAPTAAAAVASLRRLEQICGWPTLELDPGATALEGPEGPVFLKANQNNGRYQLRLEQGLGEGVLITGHSLVDPAAQDTWGPLPLQCFG